MARAQYSNAGHLPKSLYRFPAERKKEILDAALIAFSNHGYTAATTEQIAALAGLSKAGLYAHYKSKDEIFEDLLMTLLAPPFSTQSWLVDTGPQLREVIDAFIDETYANLSKPDFIAMLRLLIAESGRAPHLIHRWREEVLQPHIAAQQHMIDKCVKRGIMRDSPLTRHFEMVVAPAPYYALWQMLFGAEKSSGKLERMRETHRALLNDLLENREN